jgi:hypothetical protein
MAMILTGKTRLLEVKLSVDKSVIFFLIVTLIFEITELICIFCFVFFASVFSVSTYVCM